MGNGNSCGCTTVSSSPAASALGCLRFWACCSCYDDESRTFPRNQMDRMRESLIIALDAEQSYNKD